MYILSCSGRNNYGDHCGGETFSEHFLPKKAQNELKNLSSTVITFFTLLHSWKYSFPQINFFSTEHNARLTKYRQKGLKKGKTQCTY